jgi:CRP-like cAMP-binding protein
MNTFNPSCLHCNARIDSIFEGLTQEQLMELTANKSCSHFKKGQILFNEGGIPFGLMCINRGKIKLVTTGPEGKEQILRLAKDGEAMGYRAILTNERYNASAIAIEDSDICVVDKAFFMNQVADNKQLLFDILRKLNNRLKEAEEHVVSLSQKRVRERVAEALLFMRATYGIEEDNQTIAVGLSREEIADYVGTTTESTIRILSEFVKEGLIALNGKKIQVCNVDSLSKIARLEN